MRDTIDLDCGIAMRRITAWLDQELALPRADGRWTYAAEGGTCSIEVEPLESRMLGVAELERTHLVARGDAGALASFDKLFTLRFISAGG